MEGLDHLLELVHSDLPVVGVGGVAALGGVVVLRVVAPVELGLIQLVLLDGGVVVDRLQVHVGHAQSLHIVHAHGLAGTIGEAGLREGQVLAGVLR